MHSETPRGDGIRPAWAKVALVAIGAGVLLLVSAPVALSCPVTDPGCLTDNPKLEAPPLPTPPVGDDLGKKVDDAVNTAKDTAGNAVDDVKDAVDGLLNPGQDPGGGGDGGGGDKQPPGGPGSGGTGNPARHPVGPPVSGGGLSGPIIVRPIDTVRNEPTGLLGRVGGAALETAKQLGFPLALTLFVVAFLMLQNYLDRKDPKLALAPIRPEVMRFE